MQELQTTTCAHRLRVKLHSDAWVQLMCYCHYCAVGGMGNRLYGQAIKALNCQRVVAHCGKRGWDIGKQRMAIMRHFAHLAMHGIRCMYQLCAKVHAQRLVTKAYPQYGYALVKVIYGSHSDAGLYWGFRARANDDPVGVQCIQLCEAYFVIAVDYALIARLQQVVVQYPGK